VTCADIVKEVLFTNTVVGDWANYSNKPGFLIFGRDDMGGARPGGVGSILCKDIVENPIYAANGKRLVANQSCECVIAEETTTKRDNFFTDIQDLCEASSYSLIIKNVRRDNKRNLFINIFEIHLLN
jgi:hypothetical protein